MSAQLLREGVRSDLDKATAEITEALATRKEDTLDQMRFNQGVLFGLALARDTLDARYRNLHG